MTLKQKRDIALITVPASPVLNTLSFDPATSEVRTGETIEFDAVLDTVPDGLAGFNVAVALTNTSVGEIVGVSYPNIIDSTLAVLSTLPFPARDCRPPARR